MTPRFFMFGFSKSNKQEDRVGTTAAGAQGGNNVASYLDSFKWRKLAESQDLICNMQSVRGCTGSADLRATYS